MMRQQKLLDHRDSSRWLRMTLMVRFPRCLAGLTPKPGMNLAKKLTLLVNVIFNKSFYEGCSMKGVYSSLMENIRT
jgi:hypothetical protein